jgi:hypothetical protein
MSRVTSSSSQTVNRSIGPIGDTAPTFITLAGATDPSGNAESLSVDAAGRLLVTTAGTAGVTTSSLFYDEVNIPVGPETNVMSYTAPIGQTTYLLSISASGQNIGQFNIYLNGLLSDKQYLSYGTYHVNFNYETGSVQFPGILIPVGNVVLVTAINAGQGSAFYNARMLILGVT